MDTINQQIPSQPANYNQWLRTLGIGFGIVSFGIAIGVIGYIMGTKNSQTVVSNQQSSVVPTVYEPSPTSSDETANPDLIGANWKTYTGSILSFRYPLSWKLNEQKNNSYSFIGLRDNENSPQNEFRITIVDIQGLSPENKNATVEEKIEGIKKYEMSSTAHIGNFNPKEINKSKITVDNIEGIKYIIQLDISPELNPSGTLPYDQVTWVFIPYKDKLVELFLEGKDQNVLGQILSTFQLTP